MSATASQLDDRRVRLVRRLPGPPVRAWSYLTETRLFVTWIDGGSIDPRIGGRVTLRLPTSSNTGEPVLVEATVTRLEPPRLLEISWHDPRVEPGTLQITLEAQGDQTLLTLSQTQGDRTSGALAVALWTGALAALATGLVATPSSSGAQAPVAAALFLEETPRGPPSSGPSAPSSSGYARRDLGRVSWWHTSALWVVVALLVVGGIGGALVVPKLLVTSHPAQTSCNVGTPPGVSEPGPTGDTGWVRTNATCAPWIENGEPVLFYMGSIACPYCAASSWAIYGALQNFSNSGSLGGPGSTFAQVTWGVSNPNDVYPDTPEVEFNASPSPPAGADLWDYEGDVGTDPTAITLPSVGPPGSEYVSTWDAAASIPFVVVGGAYVHTATLVDPAIFRNTTGSVLTPQQVYAEQQAGGYTPGDGSVWGTILAAQYWLEAYMWKVDTMAGITPLSDVTSNSYVAADYAAIP